MLKELYDLIDTNKVTDNAKLRIDATVYSISKNISSDYKFGYVDNTSGSNVRENAVSLSPTLTDNHATASTNGTITSFDNISASNGERLALYYGTSSTVINLKTDANYCQLDDDNTVKDVLECNKTTAGTYALKCTVDAQGNKTYSWV